MTAFLSILVDVSVLVFSILSMLAAGLRFTARQIAGPFRYPDRIFRALVANFILVPLVTLGIARLFDLAPALEAGMLLVATAAGAPFLLKLTEAAEGDIALSAALLVLLIPVTVVSMPFVVPLVLPGASVRAASIAVPLLLTLLVPLGVGLVAVSLLPRWSRRGGAIASAISSVALVVLIVSTVVLHGPRFMALRGTGAFVGAAMLTACAFGVGFLLSSGGIERRTVMGLGAGQRNIAAALIVASSEFDDGDTLVMIVLFSVIDLFVLFPIAMVLRRLAASRAGRAREGLDGGRLPTTA